MEAEVSFTSFITALMLTSVPGSAVILYLKVRRSHFSKTDVTLLLTAFGVLAARLLLPVEVLTVTHSVFVTRIYPDFCKCLQTPVIGELSLSACFIILSLAGSVILTARRIRLYVQTARIVRRGKVSGYYPAAGKDLPIIESALVTEPFLIGLLHPAIILPAELHGNREDIILHEANHYLHHDLLCKSCFELLCMIFWWNPLIWLLRRETANMLELRNDFHTTAGFTMEEKLRYAQTLLAEAKKLTRAKEKRPALAGIGLDSSGSFLSTRIHSILEEPQKTRPMLPVLILIGAVLLSFGVIIEPSSPPMGAGYYSCHPEKSFIIEDNGVYEIYLDGVFFSDYDYIFSDFSELKIYQKGEYHDKKIIFNLIRRIHLSHTAPCQYLCSPL